MINARYSGIVNNTDQFVFHILGCGAIGSSAATQICRMGAVRFCLYDCDTVESVNIGVSQYNVNDIGKNKVDALKEHLLRINPEAAIQTEHGMFSEYSYEGENDIAILGFDSMESRLDAVKVLCQYKDAKPKYIIDGRMGAEHYQQYVVENPTLTKYMQVWYSDEDGSVEPCNAKATSYCSNMSGSFIANTIRKLIMNQPYNKGFSFNFPVMLMEKTRMVN